MANLSAIYGLTTMVDGNPIFFSRARSVNLVQNADIAQARKAANKIKV